MKLFRNAAAGGALFAIPGAAPEKLRKLEKWVAQALPVGHATPAYSSRCECYRVADRCEPNKQQQLVGTYPALQAWTSTIVQAQKYAAELDNEPAPALVAEHLLRATEGVMLLSQAVKDLDEAHEKLREDLSRRYGYSHDAMLVIGIAQPLVRMSHFDEYERESDAELNARQAKRVQLVLAQAELAPEMLRDKALWEAKSLELELAKADLQTIRSEAQNKVSELYREIIRRRESASDTAACSGIALASVSGSDTLEVTYARMSPAALRAIAQITAK